MTYDFTTVDGDGETITTGTATLVKETPGTLKYRCGYCDETSTFTRHQVIGSPGFFCRGCDCPVTFEENP